MSKCPQMLAFKHSTKPSLPAYPFMKVLVSSREDPTLLHANNTDADQSAHLRSPISAPIVHLFESIDKTRIRGLRQRETQTSPTSY